MGHLEHGSLRTLPHFKNPIIGLQPQPETVETELLKPPQALGGGAETDDRSVPRHALHGPSQLDSKPTETWRSSRNQGRERERVVYFRCGAASKNAACPSFRVRCLLVPLVTCQGLCLFSLEPTKPDGGPDAPRWPQILRGGCLATGFSGTSKLRWASWVGPVL